MEVVHLPRLVVRDVEIQVAVAVDVGEGGGRARPLRGEPRVAEFVEAARPVPQEDAVASAVYRDDEIEIRVRVEVREHGPARHPVAEAEAVAGAEADIEAGRRRHIREAPAAEVAVERARSAEAGEEEIRPPVSVDVADRHPLPFREHAVPEARLLANVVAERDPERGTVERAEPAGAPRMQLPPAHAVRLHPRPGVGHPAGGERTTRQRHPGERAPGNGRSAQPRARPDARCGQPPAPFADAPRPEPMTRSNRS